MIENRRKTAELYPNPMRLLRLQMKGNNREKRPIFGLKCARTGGGGKPIDYIQFLMTKKRETDQLQSGSPLLYWHPEQKKEEANYSQFLIPDSSFLIQSMV